MGISYKFMDNCSYGANDINSVFSKLTTHGVSLFNYSDGDNPLNSLNNATSSFVTTGIEYYNINACRLSYSEPEGENIYGTFEILPGNAFMYDGTIVTVDENRYNFTKQVRELRQVSNDDIYVYFYRNVAYNTIDVIVTNEVPQSDAQEIILLGIIDSDNAITDTRSIATTKLAPCSANVVVMDNIQKEVSLHPADTGTGKIRYTLKNIFPGANYLITDGVLCNIQQVNTLTGDELEYVEISNRRFVAVNRVGTDLQIWIFVYGYTKMNNFDYIIF